MAQRLPTVFDAYSFEEKELQIAETFTDFNILLFKTMRFDAISAQLALIFDPTRSFEFLANRAALQGKIDVLTQLIGD